MELQHLALSFLFLCNMLHFVTSEVWTRHTILDGEGKFHLYWNPPNDTNGDSEITFKVEVEAKGYFGLGLSPNGGMPGSDIVTGWVRNGTVYFQDRHATAFSLPPLDDQQDWKLIDGSENDTHTIFIFHRKLETCDEDDMVITDSTMRVIYAYSDDDPPAEDPFYHQQRRGSKSVLLLQGRSESNLNLSSLLYWDTLSPGFDASNYKTMYWCKIVKSPTLVTKHHIIYVKPMIQEGHERFVHHMLLYECVGGEAEVYEPFLDDRGHECYRPSTPAPMLKCSGFTAVWAVGGEDMTFPEHVGLPLDPPPVKYFLLEVHYDNPHLQGGIIDHSGLRFYYTPELRTYDAGLLEIGSEVPTPLLFIPPGQQEYLVAGHSNPDCLAPAFPEGGIKCFGTFLHAHLLGRKLRARHFRGKKELPPLADDENYDFNYQAYRYPNKDIDILPYDQITVECIFNSSQRSHVTFGGQSTQDEMCLVFLLYYPRMVTYGSLSAPTGSTIDNFFKTNSSDVEIIRDALLNHDWASENITEVENLMRYSEHSSVCVHGNSTMDYLSSIDSLISYPRDLEPYIPESTCDDTGSL